jgi:hypothetical protein
MYITTHIGLKSIMATPMTRGAHSKYRGWEMPANEYCEEDGYLIEYEPRLGEESNMQGHEGYVSWTPKQVFDDAYYNVNDSLPFGLALELAKQGYSIARRGWNDKGLKVSMQIPTELSKMTLPYLYIQYLSTPASDSAPNSYINAKVPWLASQTDILSSDWYVVQSD